MSFESDVKNWAKKAKLNLRTVHRSVIVELSASVILRTPVDEGYARGSWQPTVNTKATANLRRIGTALGELDGVASEAFGEVFYLTSNLPYIRPLEYGLYGSGPKTSGGYSIQAPHGMLRVTVAEFKKIVQKQARTVK